MAEQKDGKRVIKIQENPNPEKEPEGANTGKDQPPEEEKLTFGKFVRHPIKSVKALNQKHPVGTKVVGGGLVLGAVAAVAAVLKGLGGSEETAEEDDVLEDVLEDEEEDDEEEI